MKLKGVIVTVLISVMLSNLPIMASTHDVQYNRLYVKYCEEIGMKYHVSPELLEAIIEHESGGNPNVGLDWAKCYGLMGVSSKWNADRMKRLGVNNLYEPYGNILVATDLLLELFEKYEDPYEVLRFYGGYPEGDYEFSKEMLQRSWELEVIHGKQDYMTKG